MIAVFWHAPRYINQAYLILISAFTVSTQYYLILDSSFLTLLIRRYCLPGYQSGQLGYFWALLLFMVLYLILFIITFYFNITLQIYLPFYFPRVP